MSKIEELIEKLCPNGVEFKKLEEITKSINIGINPRKFFKLNPADSTGFYVTVRELNGLKGVKEYEKTDKINDEAIQIINNRANIEKGDILFSNTGTVGKLALVNETPTNWGVNEGIYIIKPIEEKILSRYLYYYLDSSHAYKDYSSKFTGSTLKHVTQKALASLIVAVPPLEVQCEIVHILDDFTLLSALLSAELKARQKQYEYYNCNLLKFENIPYYTLEELCDIVDYRGKTPKKTNEGIFLVTAKNIRKGYIDYEKSQEFISEQDYAEVMRRGMPKVGDVLITTEAPCGNVAQVDDENIALAQRVIKYRPKDNRLDSTFLKYILLGEEFQTKLNGKATGGTVKGIKGSILHKLTIPLPSIEEQRKIVKILDRFNKLCNDISEGLPAEINARQKQYEYYRDKILTFKMIGD